jgi:hypothetical protein
MADQVVEAIPVEGVDVEIVVRVDGAETVLSGDLVGMEKMLEASLEAVIETQRPVRQPEPAPPAAY